METEFKTLSKKIENWIKECDVDNRKVCFEFRDSDAIELENILKEFIRLLKEINCRIAKDKMLWSSLNQEIDKLAGEELTE